MKSFPKYFLALIIFFISGCGYTTKGLLPEYIKTVKINNFANKIDVTREVSDRSSYEVYIPGLEIQVTKEIIDRFIFDGNLQVVSEGEADLVISGSVIKYRKDALRVDRDDEVEEYRISIIVDIDVIDSKNKEPLWSSDSFAGDSTFRLSGRFASTESAARQLATKDLARRIVEKTIENW